GFLRKHEAGRAALREEGGYWVIDKSSAAVSAEQLVARQLPALLRRFPWPKSMRWGGASAFAWVRPLRRVTCLVGGTVVRFDLREGEDDGHGLVAGDLTEGHRFLAPGACAVTSCADWADKLRARYVLVDARERRRIIAERISACAAEKSLRVVDDPSLLDEVTGLVEWPVALLGRIDARFMDLPAEVMQVSMRTNQRYFALRDRSGNAAPYFAFVANIEAGDGGAAIIAGNERVLSARFADARHFWDQDRRTRLETRIALLDQITFHAKLGSQGSRVVRLARLARTIAGLLGAPAALAERAGRLAKADLVCGMVAEFPELQGVMGRYYALHDGEDERIADAIRDHYAPRGPSEPAPAAPVSIAVALADKLDLLTRFFAIGEKPTGAGDPYALRRAALGIIRTIRENALRLHLLALIEQAGAGLPDPAANAAAVLAFLAERLRVQLRAEGARHDVLAAVFAAGGDDDIVRLLARAEAVANLLGTDDGANLLIAYRRAANILRIEDRKDGPHDGPPDAAEFTAPEEHALAQALDRIGLSVAGLLGKEDDAAAMAVMAELRAPLDGFFDTVTVNAPEPHVRRNRLRLLSRVRAVIGSVADFSKIEG
ncbi:MAG: glycine--tRNA ligase subunit beta, partial [Acetobacteraceae bacterium]|nr:glycine--tRNA ligase subunit beta [Acetobacteraceae bacterium]